MKQMESVKRIAALQMSLIGVLLQTAVYAFFWLRVYYPIVNMPRISRDGYLLGEGLKLYFRGHVLVILIYLVLLWFFSNTYGALKIGYQKAADLFLSQVFSLILADVISYFQISLMRNWTVPVLPMVQVFIIQLVISFVWTYFSNAIYHKVFPPRELLLISGERPIDEIYEKFKSRKEKYTVRKCIRLAEGMDRVKEEILNNYGAVVLWDIHSAERNELLKYCYNNTIRVYVMPKIPDVLLMGAEQLHLVDTPVLMVREYAMTFAQRFFKRTIDVVCALLLTIVTSPIMLITALAIKLQDGGPVLYRQRRCTMHQKGFDIIKFRSMQVGAEADGVARLSTVGDERITGVGRFIRRVRIDELPQLFNILKGEMSFIGPRPERPEIIAEYLETMPEFAYRMRVKAGLAGYAQVYGKYNTTPYDKLKLDLTYIENYSIWLDLKLMLLTLKILLQPESTEGIEKTQVTAQRREGEERIHAE
ncbi:MAG: exopolysaccharide biosynthesis polyprenyl glycosylphosphotransferase [Lachnospiraceae bacterium]|nr:exopolysaccharide biosynthesis polyprenyl glycosylphosphotransferase [Lachnospiraceae bacterium]